MKTVVMLQGPPRHDMCGQSLPRNLTVTDRVISPGLAARIHRYALARLDQAGFRSSVEGWEGETYTIDGDDQPTDRAYSARFRNVAGGYLEVIGILTSRGWPTIDHGLSIGQD